MILRQFLHKDPIAISYLFGCGVHAACAVVDSVGETAPYAQAAEETGVKIRFVIDTQLHADHRSTARELAATAGADFVLHNSAEVAFSVRRVADGDRLPLGNVLVDVMHRPYPRRRTMVRADRPHTDGRRCRAHRTGKRCRHGCADLVR
jgi:glyoxylase-like metal-dependent hydrolase (beta-lactamase superfamily II)